MQAIEGYPGSICLAVFTLLYSIVPSASTPLSSYQYTVFDSSLAYVQYLGMVQFALQVVSSIFYGVVLNAKNVLSVLAVTTVLSGAAQLANLIFIDYSSRNPEDVKGNFGVAVGVMVLTSTVSQLAFVSLLVMITQFCYMQYGTLYGLYLSFLDLGDVGSSLLSGQLGNGVVGKHIFQTAVVLPAASLSKLVRNACRCLQSPAGCVRVWCAVDALTLVALRCPGLACCLPCGCTCVES
eukprot:m.1497428 g.1497428  ORF g.1497428 m.1497428 type:complete len:238 (-) comp25198_c0_seq26:115-828(-)